MKTTIIKICSTMKTYFKFFMSMAAAVVALSSCQKEIESKDAPAKEKGVLSITVKATQDALKSEAGTKTYIDGTSIFWGTGEYMKIGVFDGEGTAWGTSNNESADLWNGQQQALFEFSITPKTESGTYTYYGMYPASAAATSTNNDPATYKVNLPAAQNATASSYDPKAYILVAKPDAGHDAVMTDWDAAFRRATALNKITLKNLPEDIKRVSITAPENVKLAGGRHINLTTGQSDDIYSGVNKIDVKFDAPQATGSDVVVWFTSWDAEIPVDANLTIVAYSTAHTFTRTLTVANKSITFKEGCLNTLNVNMSSADQGDNTELEPGDYVILAKNGDKYFAMKAEVTGTRLVSVDYTGSLDSYNGDGDIVWTIANTGSAYTIKNGTNYLGWTSGNSADFVAEESYSDEVCLMDITYNEGTYFISSNSDASRKLAKNTSNAYFAFYTGTQYKDIVFVPATVDTRSDVTLAFEDAVVNLTTNDYDQFFGQEDVTATPSVEAVTNHLTWSYTDPDGIIDDFDNGSLLLNGNTGTATVTVSFAGDENYRPAEASYTINVTDGGTPVETGWIETAITDLSTDDIFVIVGNDTYALPYSNGSSSAPSLVGVTVSSGKLVGTIEDSIKWNISGNATDGYVFYPNGSTDTWLYCTGANNGVRVGNNTNKTFTLTNDGYLQNNATSRYLSIYNNQDWRCYTNLNNNPQVIKFYKYVDAPDTRQEAGMSWSAEAATATITDLGVDFTAPTLTPGNATGITYNSTETSVATIDGEGTIEVVAAGTTNIQAIFAGDDNYKPQTVTYTLTVTDERTVVTYDFETVAALNALVTNTSATYKGYLTDAVVSFVPATNTAFVKDATGSVMIYKSSHGLLQGQTYTGAIEVTAIKYNGNYSEITAWDATFTGETSVVDPESIDLPSLIGHYDDYQNAYVQVAGLTVESISGKNINVTDGSNSYVVYDNPGSATCTTGDVITAKGTVTKYGSTEEIKVWKADDIIVTASSPKAITFSQPSQEGCSFTVSVGGENITSGTTVASGTTVTLTATAGTDYTFKSWSVSGATVADASSAYTTFTMGTSPVTVSASFTSTGGGGSDPVTSTLTFTAACRGSGTADDGVVWTVTSDGTESTYDATKGIHYGTSKAQVQYITLSTSQITGTITRVVVNASVASSVTATASVTVGGNAFGGDAQSLTTSAAEYTFNGSASGEIVVTVTKPSKASKALYVKSIAVTYE